MDKKFWDCHCLTDYVQVKTVAVCEKCQALKVNKEGYDIIENYKFKHNQKRGNMKITIDVSQKDERVVESILKGQTHFCLNSETIDDAVISMLLTKVNQATPNSSPHKKARLILTHMIQNDVISEDDVYDDLTEEIADICR
tara:strand:- start:7601 stop:8023 length:423 start_codon:yes stop_codon:yes gene_type:complete